MNAHTFSFVIGNDSMAGFRVLLTDGWFDGLKELAGEMESLSNLGITHGAEAVWRGCMERA